MKGFTLPTTYEKETFEALVFIGLLLTAFLTLSEVLAANWRADDTQILVHTLKHPLIDSFVNPEVWQRLSPINLTPWVVLSFEVDLLLFGVSPRGFYIHQLLSICLVSISGYLLSRLWLSRWFSLIPAFLFLLGLATTDAANTLMTRHYVEGLILAIFSIYHCVLFLRTTRRKYLVLAVVLYAAAASAKEIFVPLLFVVLMLDEGQAKSRLTAFYTLSGITVLYIFWRSVMLQNLVGGYTAPSEIMTGNFLVSVLQFAQAIPEVMLRTSWGVLISIYMVLLAFLFYKKPKTAMIFGGVLVLEFLPLVPLASVPGINYPGRYYLLIWFSFCFSLGFCFKAVGEVLSTRLAALKTHAVVVLLFLIFAGCFSVERGYFAEEIAIPNAEFDAQAEFMWNRGDDIFYVPSDRLLSAYWFVRGMKELKEFEHPDAGFPNIILDNLDLTGASHPLFEYDVYCRCMVDVSEQLPGKISENKANMDIERKLTVEMSFKDNLFKWNFGPFADGHYYVFSDYLGVLRFTNEGEFFFYDIDEPLELRVGHFSPDGARTYSDILILEQDAPPIRWP